MRETTLAAVAGNPILDTTAGMLNAIDNHAWFASCSQEERKAFRAYASTAMPTLDGLSNDEWAKNVVSGPAEHGSCFVLITKAPVFNLLGVAIPLSNPGEGMQMMCLTANTNNLIQLVYDHLFTAQRKCAVFCGSPSMTRVSFAAVLIMHTMGIPDGVGELAAYLQGVMTVLVQRALTLGRLRIIGVYSPSTAVSEVKLQFSSFATQLDSDKPELELKLAKFKGDVSKRVADKIAALFGEAPAETKAVVAAAPKAPTKNRLAIAAPAAPGPRRAVAIAPPTSSVKHTGAAWQRNKPTAKPATAKEKSRMATDAAIAVGRARMSKGSSGKR